MKLVPDEVVVIDPTAVTLSRRRRESQRLKSTAEIPNFDFDSTTPRARRSEINKPFAPDSESQSNFSNKQANAFADELQCHFDLYSTSTVK